MKFLTIFLLCLITLCGYFWATDAKGSGMGRVTGGLTLLTGGVLLFNKKRTGSWFSDSAPGR